MLGAMSPWAVFRQDDHGHRALVRQTEDRAEAERLLAEYEARGHKQTYWIEPIEPPDPPPCSAMPEEIPSI
jgi:hypothetical protein